MKQRITIFLDIDGVMNRYGFKQDKLDPKLVAHLEWLSTRWTLSVVTNSAWNSYGLERIRAAFVAAGLKSSRIITGMTNSNGGGGGPVRQYLRDHDLVGTPFFIVDDSTHDYGEMWCRLVHCDGRKGFDVGALKNLDQMIGHCHTPESQRDRRQALTNLGEYCFWLMKADWLSFEEKERHIYTLMESGARFLTAPNFLEAAMLVKAASPESGG